MNRFISAAAAAAILFASPAAHAANETPQQRMTRAKQDRDNAAVGQVEGNYGNVPADVFPLGAMQPAFDNPKPATDQVSIGVKRIPWSEDMVMRIRTRHGMVTAINFSPSEAIEAVYLGDQLLFDAQIVSPTLVVITARRPGADTNMVARGRSGNVYNFYIRGEGATSRIVPDMSVFIDILERGSNGPVGSSRASRTALTPVSTLQPQTAVANASTARAIPASDVEKSGEFARDVPFDPSKLNFDLGIFVNDKDSLVIAPKRVFRDDIFTYLDFGPNADSMMQQPVVSLSIDGTDSYVATRTTGPNGNIIVVEAVGDLTLRNGQEVVCIRRLGPNEKPLTETGVSVQHTDADTPVKRFFAGLFN